MRSFTWRLWIVVSLVLFSFALVSAKEERNVLELSSREVEGLLQECPLVQKLNHERLANSPETSSLMKRVFALLFPAGPAVNSLLATAYISGPPNFLLALVPTNIDPASLSVMVAFAVGGLLGDTLLHLIPQTFMGEPHGDGVHFVMLDPKRNALLGLFIFVGFVTFVAMDKTMRILGGGDGHSHSHSHTHEDSEDTSASTSSSIYVGDKSGDVKSRKGNKSSTPTDKAKDGGAKKPEASNSIKLSSYLNLIADFSHNITDGLAMSAAFYAGPMVGATTTVAVFFHEIPHEVGDFALLVQSGFTKWQAMGAQFFTAVGAFLGTFIGIAIQTYSASGTAEEAVGGGGSDAGIWGTGLTAGDLVLPFTAGTFLYVGFSVIPELLETGKNKAEEVRKSITQAIAMALGFGIMFAISWAEG